MQFVERKLLHMTEADFSQIINEVLRKSYNETQCYLLRLADDPQATYSDSGMGTEPPISPTWTSPHLGKTINTVVEYVQSAPEYVNRQHFAVIDFKTYQERNKVMIYRVVNGQPQGIPCTVEEISLCLIGYDRDTWEASWQRWLQDGKTL